MANRETMETVIDIIFLGPKITADGNCNHERKRHLLLGRKAMANLDSILKSRHYFVDKGLTSQGYGFSKWSCIGCEGWTIKKAKQWRIDAFELWCGRRLLRVPWTARRSNQSILKEISTGCSLEGLMLKLPILWSPGANNWLIGKDSDARWDWGQEKKGTTGDEMVGWNPWLNGHEFEQALGDGDAQGSLACCKELDTTEGLNINMPNEVTERLSRYSLAVCIVSLEKCLLRCSTFLN